MQKKAQAYGHSIGTEMSKCPKCGQGILFFTDCLGGRSMVLECARCKSRFYKNCGCELFDLTDELYQELQKTA